MELSTLLGIVVALTGLLGGMHFKGVPFSALANPAAIFIILIGTFGAILNAFPMEDMKKLGSVFKIVFTKQNKQSNVEIVKQFVEFAQFVRKEGMLALEAKIPEIEDPFFAKGLELLMTGLNRDFLEDVMDQQIQEMQSRHRGYAGFFSQAGTYAPTLGVLGAVIGLIAALSHLDDQEALGHAISAAFMATLYGIFTGYVLWHPFSNKLKRNSEHEVLTKRIIQQGILLLEQGMAPNLVMDSLATYLPPKEAAELYDKKGGE